MPYKDMTYTKEVPPEVIASHKGIAVYHEYYQNDIRQRNHYWYAIYPDNDTKSKGKVVFDVRDLPQAEGVDLMPSTLHAMVIKQALMAGDIPPKERAPVAKAIPEPIKKPKAKETPTQVKRGRPPGSKNKPK